MQQIGLDATLNNVPDFTSGIDKMNKAVDSFAQQGTESGNSFQKGFGEIVTGALREIGTIAIDALAKGGQAVAGFLKDSVGVAGDFQQEFAQFQIAVGHTIDGTGLKLDDFKKQFISLGKELPVSTSEVEQAAVEMARGGIDPAVIAAGGLKQTIQFASAALKGDLVQAAQISAKTMQAWTSITDSAATKTDFLTHAQNLMTQATTAASTTVDQLFLGLSNVGGTARIAGVSFDETVKALAQLTPSFASSADAGTSLKTFFARLQPETKPAIAAMQELGLWTEKGGSAFYDAQGKFIGMQAAEDLLQKATANLTDAQRQQALQQIFGNDAIRAAGVFALQGQAGYDALSDSISKQTTLTDAARINQDTYNTAVENAKGSVEALQITVGSALLPILTDLMNNTIAPAVNTLTTFASALIGDKDAFSQLSPVLQETVTTISALIGDVQNIVKAFNDGGASTTAFAHAVDTLTTDLGAPAGLIENIITEVQKLTKAFDTGGISGLIDQMIADITAAIPDIQKALLSWGQAFVDWVQPMIPPVIKALGDMAAAGWDWVKAQAPEWGKQLLIWGNEFVTWIAPMIPPAIAELGKLAQQFLSWIGEQAQPILVKFQDWATSFSAWIGPATVAFLKEWPNTLDKFLDWIGNAAGPILKQLGDWALSFIQWVAPMIPPFLLEVGKIALAIGAFVVETAAVLSKKIVEVWVPAILTWIVTDAIPGLVKALDNFLKVFQGWIEDAQKSLARWMIDVGKSIVQGIQNGIEVAWGSFTSWIHDQIMKIPEAVRVALHISSPSQVMADLVGAPIVQGITQGMQTATPAMLQGVEDIGSQIIGGFEDTGIADELLQLGKDAMDGFGKGIKRGMGSVMSAINSAADSVEGAFKDAFQAHSPSERMVPVGQFITEGILQGLTDAWPTLTDQIGSLADSLVGKMKDIGTQMQDAIASGFGATASIDRQIAKNLDSFKDVLPEYAQYTTGALKQAQDEAQAMLDPAEGAKYFKMRSDQILEYAKLQKQLSEAQNADDQARIKQQMLLINQAQTAEISQFNATAQAQSPLLSIADQINAVMMDISKINLTDNQIQMVNALASIWSTLVAPVQTRSDAYAHPPPAPTVTSTTNLNMPIYSNNSPSAMQDSMAIAMSALP